MKEAVAFQFTARGATFKSAAWRTFHDDLLIFCRAAEGAEFADAVARTCTRLAAAMQVDETIEGEPLISALTAIIACGDIPALRSAAHVALRLATFEAREEERLSRGKVAA